MSLTKVDPQRLSLLNQGKLETKNLMEALSIDFHSLLNYALPSFLLPQFPPKCGITKKMILTAHSLFLQYELSIFEFLKNHPSDTLRGLACYLLASQPNPSIPNLLNLIHPLADDPHFGVREWAWLALRPQISSNITLSISLLLAFIAHPSENIRRFATEITRPRGVWSSHIKELRLYPELALPLLEPLKNDPAKYVQLSLANWLNDASKDHPNWVRSLCSRWLHESNTPSTQKICKRALRNLI